jgi:hypothetical protein
MKGTDYQKAVHERRRLTESREGEGVQRGKLQLDAVCRTVPRYGCDWETLADRVPR